MHNCSAHTDQSTPEARDFYRKALAVLLEAEIPFLVGGGYAVFAHTGIARMTKDIDLFLTENDLSLALHALSSAGYHCELAYPHWLAKAHLESDFIDLIFNSGNGCCPVDRRWFDHAKNCVVLGLPVQLCPPEESIWQKAFIMERERYDGADVAHLLKECGPELDWNRMLERFGEHWPVLYSHLVLFRYIYPGHEQLIPKQVLVELARRFDQAPPNSAHPARVCRGPLLSREQYVFDIEELGYQDARLHPLGEMSNDDVARYTRLPRVPK